MISNDRDLIVGSSSAVSGLRRNIANYAPLPFPVLIQGETGTGKERIALELHRQSGRNRLVIVDCTTLSCELLGSELFGHERGAFTGAICKREGMIEAAQNGTLFLDEVGELELRLQPQLLRFLQEKQFRRVGSNEFRTGQCRIIAATNRDLASEVAAGKFRADLYNRLRVLTITVPPLRERSEDIPELIEYFRTKHNLELRFEPGTMARLVDFYHWPGNIRELEHVVIQLAATIRHRGVSVADLSNYIPRADSTPDFRPSDNSPSAQPSLSLREAIEEKIIKALGETQGNREAAAKLLGIGRTTLYRRLREMTQRPPLTCSDRQTAQTISKQSAGWQEISDWSGTTIQSLHVGSPPSPPSRQLGGRRGPQTEAVPSGASVPPNGICAYAKSCQPSRPCNQVEVRTAGTASGT